MDELMIVANVAIVFGVVYKLFELFVCRKERMMLIEKLGEKLTPEEMRKGLFYSSLAFSFNALRWGCLLLGLGAGMIASFFITDAYEINDVRTLSNVYGACVLVGGGLGLIVSYLIESYKMRKK